MYRPQAAPALLRLLPGLGLATALAVLANLIAGPFIRLILGNLASPVSAVMVALILGMLLGNSRLGLGSCQAGLKFASKQLLRLGIMLLGLRLSLAELASIGLRSLPLILACVASALLLTWLVARLLRLSGRLGTLIAVGTSICGVSAIAATSPAIDASESETSYAISIITIFGLLATLLYPLLLSLFPGLSGFQIGLFLGTAIHDTSQVSGAAVLFEQLFGLEGVLNTATVTKLARNLLMLLVIPLMTLLYHRQPDTVAAGGRPSLRGLFPLFVLGFVGLSMLRSLGDYGLSLSDRVFGSLSASAWQGIHQHGGRLGQFLIVIALAAVGLGTRFASFRGLGLKPLLAGLVAALATAAVSLVGLGLFY